jgi:hypothetical protein
MTSAINPNLISVTFPVAGRDNDSQGFRNNFAEIVGNFTTAASEITALQTNGIDVSLTTNDLIHTTLDRGIYLRSAKAYTTQASVSGTVNIDLENGTVHKITLSADGTITFINWPSYGSTQVYSSVIVILSGVSGSPVNVNFASQGPSTPQPVILEDTISSVTVDNTALKVFEAWTVDQGTNTFLRSLGMYTL